MQNDHKKKRQHWIFHPLVGREILPFFAEGYWTLDVPALKSEIGDRKIVVECPFSAPFRITNVSRFARIRL